MRPDRIVYDDDFHASLPQRLDSFHQNLDRDIARQACPSLFAAPSAQGQGASVVVPTADAPDHSGDVAQ